MARKIQKHFSRIKALDLQNKVTILESQLSHCEEQHHKEVQRLTLQLNQTKKELKRQNAFHMTNEYSTRSNQKLHQCEEQIKYLLEQQQQEPAKNERTNFEYEKQFAKLQNEKEKLSQQLLKVGPNNYKEYIAALKHANQELHQHLSTLNQERDFLQIQNQDFSTEIQKLNIQVGQLSEKLFKKRDVVDSSSSLNRELQTRELEIKNLFEQFHEQRKENEFLKSTLSDYDKHLHMLNSQKETLSQEEKSHFEKLIFTSKDEAARMQELIKQLKQRLSNSNQERDSLQIKHDSLLKKIQELLNQEVQVNINRPSFMIPQSSSLDKQQNFFTNQVQNQTEGTKEKNQELHQFKSQIRGLLEEERFMKNEILQYMQKFEDQLKQSMSSVTETRNTNQLKNVDK